MSKYRTALTEMKSVYVSTIKDGYYPSDRIKKQLVKAILLKK